MNPPIPPALARLTNDLLEHGWSFHVAHAEDSSHAAFIRVQAIRKGGNERLEVTWHSRETGGQRYRWRSGFHDNKPIKALARVRDIICADIA